MRGDQGSCRIARASATAVATANQTRASVHQTAPNAARGRPKSAEQPRARVLDGDYLVLRPAGCGLDDERYQRRGGPGDDRERGARRQAGATGRELNEYDGRRDRVPDGGDPAPRPVSRQGGG